MDNNEKITWIHEPISDENLFTKLNAYADMQKAIDNELEIPQTTSSQEIVFDETKETIYKANADVQKVLDELKKSQATGPQCYEDSINEEDIGSIFGCESSTNENDKDKLLSEIGYLKRKSMDQGPQPNKKMATFNEMKRKAEDEGQQPKKKMATIVIDDSDEDSDCCIVSSTSEPPAEQTRSFRPVGSHWMRQKCQELKLPTNDIRRIAPKTAKPLTVPERTKDVKGDGNCWFRCVSYWITGSQHNHLLIRDRLYEFFKTDEKAKKAVDDVAKHLIARPINISGTWATETEIYATALMLNTNIFIYSTTTGKWLPFGRNGRLSDVLPADKCIYIMHKNGNHYQVVKRTR